ncbi:MAG: PhnD/SsuA/transferrin family substrate-binding protein, partial [Pseudomonadota bacterium]|nr:PhnD/SsuA/transferrin family substrate-binding protein [Pseudomonadota bacterium]
MKARLWWCFLALLLAGDCLAASPRETLTFGVFAYRPDDILRERYSPLADYLARETGVDIRLEVLNQEAMTRAVTANRVDL